MSGLRGRKDGYDYIGNHTEAVLFWALEPTYKFYKLKESYTFKAFGAHKISPGLRLHAS